MSDKDVKFEDVIMSILFGISRGLIAGFLIFFVLDPELFGTHIFESRLYARLIAGVVQGTVIAFLIFVISQLLNPFKLKEFSRNTQWIIKATGFGGFLFGMVIPWLLFLTQF